LLPRHPPRHRLLILRHCPTSAPQRLRRPNIAATLLRRHRSVTARHYSATAPLVPHRRRSATSTLRFSGFLLTVPSRLHWLCTSFAPPPLCRHSASAPPLSLPFNYFDPQPRHYCPAVVAHRHFPKGPPLRAVAKHFVVTNLLLHRPATSPQRHRCPCSAALPLLCVEAAIGNLKVRFQTSTTSTLTLTQIYYESDWRLHTYNANNI
jgi:hypothetical protein